jgi:hypothetical protein
VLVKAPVGCGGIDEGELCVHGLSMHKWYDSEASGVPACG